MRKYYSDFVKHMARFYFSVDSAPSIERRVDYNNYIAVSNVLSSYEPEVVNIIYFVYTSEAMPRAVSEQASKHKMKEEDIWYIIQKFEREVSHERGIL